MAEVIVQERGTGTYTQDVIAGEHRLTADEPKDVGGDGAGPGPYDYLLAALGACTSMTIRMYVQRKAWPLRRILVRLSHDKIYAKDAHENINRLTELCGELLGSTWAEYCRLDGGQLHAIGRWRTPEGFGPSGQAEGRICADVIKQGSNELMVVRHLSTSHYAQTDPYVLPCQLQTYLGQAVRRNGRYIGSLCNVYQQDILPREGDRRLIGIIASAIGVEEERKQAEQALQQAYDETEKILASVPGAILVTDEGLRVVYANALACQYFNEGRAETVGASLNDMLPVDVAQRCQVFMQHTPQTA